MSDDTLVTREYVDNFSVKEYVENGLLDKYFEDIDVSLRTVGMVGYTTELITNCTEDTFNAGSILFRESFPNRAQIAESIYSHAAIFQLDDIFSTASTCTFLLVVEEAAIIKNMINDYDKDSGIYHFYIDKNTTIYVEDIPFTIDYDIRMDIIKRTTETGEDYLYTAKYIMDDYTNSISDITDPYVKLRKSSDGYIALEVHTHQCMRDVRYESIITNSSINYPVIDINYDGKLAGFDILYKAPTDTGYKQMQTLIVYSQPLKNPFCYYQSIDEETIRLTFNTKDTFFMPEFNSEIKVILYITDGESGKFDVYNGTDISLIPDNETYPYANTYLTAAKPIGSSYGGKDQMDMDSLQALAVEGYRTANALTTENDLQEFFNNYKHRYGDSNILFIKKRDDIYERVYSGFTIFKKNNFIYKTNTLNLKLNLFDFENVEKDVFALEPGCVFTSNNSDGYAYFFRNEEKYNQYYAEYLKAIEEGTINYIEDIVDQSSIPEYLKRPASYAEFKSRKGLDDKVSVFDLVESDFNNYDDPQNNKYLLINPFLIRFTKNPNLVSTYMTYVTNTSLVDFTNSNNDSYVQFIMYTLYLDRRFEKEKKYSMYTNIASSINIGNKTPLIKIDEEVVENGKTITKYHLNDKYSLEENDLRVFMVVKQESRNICYTELIPSEVSDDGNIKFVADMFTDDHITSDGKLRILPGTIYRNRETGDYYKVQEKDATLYNKYNKDDELIEENIHVDDVTNMTSNGILYKWSNTVNMTLSHDILIPMSDVTVKIYTLYNRIYSAENSGLINATEAQTDNILVNYDDSLKGYIWTNEYSTASSPITFIKPLDSVRTCLSFEDYTAAYEDEEGNTVFKHDILDVNMTSIPFLRASTVLDEERLDYFMDLFYSNYNILTDIIKNRLRNVTNIDVKFYNTYGSSKNFLIGEENEVLDTVNLRLEFEMWFIQGTDLLMAIPEVKSYIKSEVEKINSKGMNNLFISNLMRKIENRYGYVDHIKFKSINKYDSTYQAVKNYATDLNDLTVEERRFYVPELLVCDEDDIIITEFYVS